MQNSHKNNAKVFKAFCDEKRLAILELLRSGEKCACVLIEQMNIGQSSLSYHMKILCESGIVQSRQEGKWTHYRISEEGSNYAKQLLTQVTTENIVCECNACGDRVTQLQDKPKVGFICVHNSCRSQIAEALGKHFASDVFESYSAGTEIKQQINKDAVRLIKERYGIDMEIEQKSKLLHEMPEVDIIITMGCNVVCPSICCKEHYDWGLEDPTGKSDDEFNLIIDEIENNIKELSNKLANIKE